METTMTDATIALAGMAELADKGPDVDMLRQMVQFMAQRLMDMDVESLCGAGYDEKSTERFISPEIIQPPATVDSMAIPCRSIWLCTNLAGGNCC